MLNGEWLEGTKSFKQDNEYKEFELEEYYYNDVLMKNLLNILLKLKNSKTKRVSVDPPFGDMIKKKSTSTWVSMYDKMKKHIKDNTDNEKIKYFEYLIHLIELFYEGLFINNYLSLFLETIQKRNNSESITKEEITIIKAKSRKEEQKIEKKTIMDIDKKKQQTIKLPEQRVIFTIENSKKEYLKYYENPLQIKKGEIIYEDPFEKTAPVREDKTTPNYNQFKIMSDLNYTTYQDNFKSLDIIRDSYVYIIGHIRSDINKSNDYVYGNIGTLYYMDKLNHNSSHRKIIDNTIKYNSSKKIDYDPTKTEHIEFINRRIEQSLSSLQMNNIFDYITVKVILEGGDFKKEGPMNGGSITKRKRKLKLKFKTKPRKTKTSNLLKI